MNPRVSSEAERDLDEMDAWLTENWGPLAAANVIEAVLLRIAALADLPLAGAPRPELGKAVRFVTARRYVIYYEARADELTVLRILHAARDRDALLRRDTGETP